ncbi:hypothetical protein K439DRAFT_1637465 [Ramaria rubella]|nr:hypothetical protein K439DRAFT_1637465 [Ramaria rubella]
MLARIARERPLFFALGAFGTIGSLWWAVRDYYQWKALGPGGRPSNLLGWLQVSLISPRAMSQRKITDTSNLDSIIKQIISQEGEEAVFKALDLQQRRDGRPDVRGVIPQRQLDSLGSQTITDEINAFLITLASDYPTLLRIAPSSWEGGHVNALFLRRAPVASDASTTLSARMLTNVAPRLEIVHAHNTDGSLHVSLSPADAAEIIRKGWGVRHRLAGKIGVPSTYLMVYAPRDAEEVTVVKKIIAATVEYSTGLCKVA